MRELLDSPGMVAALVAVLIAQALSLLLLFVNVQIFRSQSGKYRLLLANLGDEASWGAPGRIILPAYVLLTLAVTVGTTAVFVFQPHFF